MKINLFRFLVLATVALVLASTAYAQGVNVRAKVPFQFVLGDKTYPAGEYNVQTITDSKFILRLTNTDAKDWVVTYSHPTISLIPAKQTVLVFHRRGTTYFLYRVWSAESSVGREFSRSRTETRMALNTTSAGTVIVAANVVN